MKNVMTDKALKTRRLVVCAALCALSFVFLLIGAVTDVLDLTMLMLSSFCITFAVIEIGGRWAWLIYGVTAVLSLIMLPSKPLAFLYLLLGAYPIAKAAFETLRTSFAWLLKFSAFNTMQLIFLLLAQKMLGLTGPDYQFTAGVLIFNNIIFLVYDIAMTVFISFYLIRLRKRLRFPPLRDL